MRSCCTTKGAQSGALWWPRAVGWGGGDRGSRGRWYMYNYGWCMLLDGRNQQNIVKIKKQKTYVKYWYIFFSYQNKLNSQNVVQNLCQNTNDEIIYLWQIEIPKINCIANISEGTDENTLDKYVGHFENSKKRNGNLTALPDLDFS